jgi:hypothetical protein
MDYIYTCIHMSVYAKLAGYYIVSYVAPELKENLMRIRPLIDHTYPLRGCDGIRIRIYIYVLESRQGKTN